MENNKKLKIQYRLSLEEELYTIIMNIDVWSHQNIWDNILYEVESDVIEKGKTLWDVNMIEIIDVILDEI